jgi:GT2 family glycosyltransferase
LFSDEEPELCLRIRNEGYQILRLPRTIVFHYTAPREALSTFLTKRQGNIWLGFGQNIRYLWGTPIFWTYLKERGWAISPAFVIGIGLLAALASIISSQWLWLLIWVAFLLLLIIGVAIRKNSLKHALLILFRRLLVLDGTIRGCLLKPYDPGSYPGSFEIIKRMD